MGSNGAQGSDAAPAAAGSAAGASAAGGVSPAGGASRLSVAWASAAPSLAAPLLSSAMRLPCSRGWRAVRAYQTDTTPRPNRTTPVHEKPRFVLEIAPGRANV